MAQLEVASQSFCCVEVGFFGAVGRMRSMRTQRSFLTQDWEACGPIVLPKPCQQQPAALLGETLQKSSGAMPATACRTAG